MDNSTDYRPEVRYYCKVCKKHVSVELFTPSQQKATPHEGRKCRSCANAVQADYYYRNREKAKAQQRKQTARVREQVLDHYGRECACCGEDMERFLCIDHINNDGYIHRKEIKASSGQRFYYWLIENNFPEGFQTLCYNCNQGKHQNGGVCPHKDLMKHPDQDHEDEVHEIKHPVGHGLLDSRRDLHNRSPHAMNTPIVGSQPPMDPTQGPQYA